MVKGFQHSISKFARLGTKHVWLACLVEKSNKTCFVWFGCLAGGGVLFGKRINQTKHVWFCLVGKNLGWVQVSLGWAKFGREIHQAAKA